MSRYPEYNPVFFIKFTLRISKQTGRIRKLHIAGVGSFIFVFFYQGTEIFYSSLQLPNGILKPPFPFIF